MMIKTPPVFQAIFLLFLISIYSLHTVFGQEEYKKGYVVTLKNDTLHGMVSNRKLGPFGGIHKRIKLKGKRFKKRFAPEHINAYKIGESTYRTMLLGENHVFMRVETEAYLSHYVYELQEQGEEMVLDVDYFKKEDRSTMIRATQGVFGLKRKKLMRFFDDCPPLVQKLKNKEFTYAFEVAGFYNDWKKKR